MNFRNISQATYDRLVDAVRTPKGDAWRPRIQGQDARDLLEAYEGAMVLLEQLRGIHRPPCLQDAVDDFLFLPGDALPFVHRVVLDDGEPLTHSARGELRPSEVDSEDY